MLSTFHNISSLDGALPDFRTCFALAVKNRSASPPVSRAWSISARHSAICWTLQLSNSKYPCRLASGFSSYFTLSLPILCFRNTEASAPFTLERLPPKTKRSSKSVSPVWSVSWIKFRTTLPISESFCPNACRELARPCASAQWFYCRVVISKTSR